MFESIRSELTESYKHRPISGHICAACGVSNYLFALHVIEFSHPDGLKTPENMVPMSRSQGRARGSVPLCNKCCPTCNKCSLPIATRWIKKMVDALTERHDGIRFRIGNGYCRHVHILNDIASLFRLAKLADIPDSKSKPTRATASPESRIAPESVTFERPQQASSPEQIGYLLSLLLTNATTSKGAALMATALQIDITSSVEAKYNLISELAPLNACHLIVAASASYPEPISERVIKSLLRSAEVTLFEDLGSRFKDFPHRYQMRLDDYYQAFSVGHPATSVAQAFLRNLGFDPRHDPKRVERVSQSLAAFFNSTMGMLKEHKVAADT